VWRRGGEVVTVHCCHGNIRSDVVRYVSGVLIICRNHVLFSPLLARRRKSFTCAEIDSATCNVVSERFAVMGGGGRRGERVGRVRTGFHSGGVAWRQKWYGRSGMRKSIMSMIIIF
jgi:hypothetical protein